MNPRRLRNFIADNFRKEMIKSPFFLFLNKGRWR